MEEAFGWKLTPYQEATSRLERIKPGPLTTETVKAAEALGRVLGEDITAEVDVPIADLAFMDGYALRAEDTRGAAAERPVSLKVVGRVFAGETPSIRVSPGQAVKIAHYALMPVGADAVAPVEIVKEAGDMAMVERPVREGMSILRAGADLRKGSILLKRGYLLRPQDLALLADIGRVEVRVVKRPKVAVLSVGDDIVKMAEKRVIEDVSGMAAIISKLIQDLGGIPLMDTAPDEVSTLKDKLRASAQRADMVLTIGGLSVGEEDYVPQALEAAGELITRGVALIPPWLSTFGVVEGKPVVCLPARYIPLVGTFYCFAVPILTALSGIEAGSLLPSIKARMSGEKRAMLERHFFLPVSVKKAEGGFVAKSVFKGPHPISSLVEANGYILIPAGAMIRDGDEVEIHLLSRMDLDNLMLS